MRASTTIAPCAPVCRRSSTRRENRPSKRQRSSPAWLLPEPTFWLLALTPPPPAAVLASTPAAVYSPQARAITLRQSPAAELRGNIAILSAGTSDQPVAEEAAVTAELFGSSVVRIYDVGVAGLHRLLSQREALSQADVIIVCAGMEGALPSVVGGLVGVPVIAVPTSVGYGASFQGATALLGMLNSCSPNVTVVNIDNGFGAAYTAVLIARASFRSI